MRRWADFCRELRELGELGEGEGAFRDGLIWAANCADGANWGGGGCVQGRAGCWTTSSARDAKRQPRIPRS